jgi:hypothetical protein
VFSQVDLFKNLKDSMSLEDVGEMAGKAAHKAVELIAEKTLESDAAKVLLGKENVQKAQKLNEVRKEIKTAEAVINTGAAAGAAVSAATGLTVAATSGAGITSGLAAAGGVVGGGMAAGPAVLAAGPAYAGAKIINNTVWKDEPDLSSDERSARAAARKATSIGAAAGVAGAGAATVAGGASGAAIMSTLAGIGGVVGGGAIAGTAIVALAPIAAAGAIGYGAYKLFGGKKR